MESRKEVADAEILASVNEMDARRLRRLLAEGGNPNTALIRAVNSGASACARVALEAGASRALASGLLAVAADRGFHGMVNTLLDYGADPRANRNEAFYCAIRRGHSRIAGLLLRRGADPTEGVPKHLLPRAQALVIGQRLRELRKQLAREG
jgi:hypothetical protein